MKFKEVLEDTKYLCETIRKQGNKYYVYSHKTPGKKLAKGEGYGSLRGAVRAMMMTASRGGFTKNPHKDKVVNDYIKRHNLGE